MQQTWTVRQHDGPDHPGFLLIRLHRAARKPQRRHDRGAGKPAAESVRGRSGRRRRGLQLAGQLRVQGGASAVGQCPFCCLSAVFLLPFTVFLLSVRRSSPGAGGGVAETAATAATRSPGSPAAVEGGSASAEWHSPGRSDATVASLLDANWDVAGQEPGQWDDDGSSAGSVGSARGPEMRTGDQAVGELLSRFAADVTTREKRHELYRRQRPASRTGLRQMHRTPSPSVVWSAGDWAE